MVNLIPTSLSLFEWGEIIGLSPYWLQQIGDDVPVRGSVQNVGCEHVFFEKSWQAYEFLGRFEVLEAIAQAEQLFADIVGYWPAPVYIVDERHSYPRHYDRQFPIRYGMRAVSGQFKAIQTKYGQVKQVGTETLTSLGDFPVVLSDETGSGIDDTFTIAAIVPSGTLPAAIAAFFVSADRAGLSLEESEIKPLTVSIAGVNATITGHVSLLVLPELQLKVAPDTLSAIDTAIYASDVTIYTREVDITDTGSLMWSNLLPCEQPPCEATLTTACFGVRDLETGWLEPVAAAWDETTEQFNAAYPCCVGRDPDRVAVNYYAGYSRQTNGKMNSKMARIIALLATGLLPNRLCGCSRADARLYYYRTLPTDEKSNLLIPRATMEAAGNALGNMTRGACESWRLMEPLIQYGSVNLSG